MNQVRSLQDYACIGRYRTWRSIWEKLPCEARDPQGPGAVKYILFSAVIDCLLICILYRSMDGVTRLERPPNVVMLPAGSLLNEGISWVTPCAYSRSYHVKLSHVAALPCRAFRS
jgi:hypothetical protein